MRNEQAEVSSILVAMVLLALGVIADAQQAKKVHRIGFLAAPLSFLFLDSLFLVFENESD